MTDLTITDEQAKNNAPITIVSDAITVGNSVAALAGVDVARVEKIEQALETVFLHLFGRKL